MKLDSCLNAQRDKETVVQMIDDYHAEHGKTEDFANIHEAMVSAIYYMMCCKEDMHKATPADWKEYNREKYGAVYPEEISEVEHGQYRLTDEECSAWVAKIGEHWNLETTTLEAKKIGIDFEEISPVEWWATMNMIYSDFFKQGRDLSTYLDLTHKFLFDVDGYAPCEKLYRFWKFVVKH